MPPNSVVKIVESASRMSPARCSFGGIQMQAVELRVARLGERVRAVEINGLAREHMDGIGVLGGQLIVRQVEVEVERR